MPRISVVTDSGADLYEPMAHMYSIHEVPAVVRVGEAVFLDGEITPAEFWRAVFPNAMRPRVSPPSALAFHGSFASLLERNDHVLCLTSSDKLAGAYRAALKASQHFHGDVTVFDTRALSLAQAYQVIVAAEAIAQAQPLPDVIRLLHSVRARTHAFICPDTTEYVRTGGRLDRTLRTIEPILQRLRMRVLLRVKDGQLAILGTSFSQTHGVWRMRREIIRRGQAEMLTVVHTQRPTEAQALAQRLAAAFRFPQEEVLITDAGPVFSCLFGPGAIAASIVQRSR